ELWGQTWRPRLSLGQRAHISAEDRVMLDAGQLAILDGLQENSRVLVEGAAGSGKTLLAREMALRLAGAGRRVLLLTFTEALARGKPLWAFHDPAQRYWKEREIPHDLFAARFRLPCVHRCHPAIQALADCYAGKLVDDQSIRAGLTDGTLAVVSCPSESSIAG